MTARQFRFGARLAAVALLACLAAGTACAEPVDLELVLAADVSRSITEEEFVLQRRGYAAAFMDPRVLQAIQAGRHRAIAVTFVEWSSSDEQLVVVDWTVLRDGETAGTFADRLLAAPRSFQSRCSLSKVEVISLSTHQLVSECFEAHSSTLSQSRMPRSICSNISSPGSSWCSSSQQRMPRA